MAWREVPWGLYRGEWEAKKSRLDYCGSLSTKRGALFVECGCLNALSGRRKIAQRALNDKVIVLRQTKLHNFILRSRVNMAELTPKIRIVSTAFGSVEGSHHTDSTTSRCQVHNPTSLLRPTRSTTRPTLSATHFDGCS